MATFFDTDNRADVDLLYSEVRDHTELVRVVDGAERDILLKFQVRTAENTYEIYLEGYDDATPADSEATLKDALKYAVAKVAEHRLRFYDDKGVYESEKLVDYSYSRGAGAGPLDTDWPSGWDAELSEFYSEKKVWFHV